MNRDLTKLFNGQKIHTVNKNQFLITPNEDPRGVYCIRSGYVKVYDISPSGDPQIISIQGPGDIFPIYWALDEEDRQLFFETMCFVSFSIMPKDEFKAAINSSTVTLQAIIRYLLRGFRFSQERVKNLEYVTAQERVAYRLLFMATYFGRKSGRNIIIDVPVRYEDIANAINCTRDTVNRTARKFIKNGIISRTASTVTIINLPKLKAIVADNS